MLELKRAITDDIDELVRLRIEFLCEISKTSVYDPLLSENLYNYFRENMINENFASWLAMDGDKVIGTSGICFYNLPPNFKNYSGKTAYVMNMYVLKEYRNQGIAFKLFNKMIEEAKEKECSVIYLHATEQGRPLYEKFGFKNKNDEMIYYI